MPAARTSCLANETSGVHCWSSAFTPPSVCSWRCWELSAARARQGKFACSPSSSHPWTASLRNKVFLGDQNHPSEKISSHNARNMIIIQFCPSDSFAELTHPAACTSLTFRASRLIDNDTHTFDWDSCTRKSMAEAQRTRWKPFTTRSIDKSLYWCRIPENSWSRAVVHDKTNWRVLTICSASDMSWGYFTTRWQINWPERLDSREHQNWTRNGSHNQLPTR